MVIKGRERFIMVILPYATFGLIVKDGYIVDAPPIAKWAIGKREEIVAAIYRTEKGAEFKEIE